MASGSNGNDNGGCKGRPTTKEKDICEDNKNNNKARRKDQGPRRKVAVRVLGVCGGIGSGKSSACKVLVSELGCKAHIDADSIGHGVYNADTPASRAVLNQMVEIFGPDIVAQPAWASEAGSTATAATTDGGGGGGGGGERSRLEIDRAKLGSIVFADRRAMSKLEGLVWPHVEREIQHRIESIRKSVENEYGAGGGASAAERDDDSPNEERKDSKNDVVTIVVEAAVLMDAGWHELRRRPPEDHGDGVDGGFDGIPFDGLWVVRVPRATAAERLVSTRGLTREQAEARIDAQRSRRGIGNLDEEVAKRTVTAVIDNAGTRDELIRTLSEKLNDPSAWY